MAQIRLANHKGDEVIATYDPAKPESIELAQQKLTAFLEECVQRYNTQPPVWARRVGAIDFDVFEGDLAQVDEVMLQYPLVGG